ncbi:DUF934 domain-containing protein [Pseudenhygromyxa sp. WMMC2535]|uniref:DUF934 domain-containing protein n=1 Tax=Pseudenhygromyxa sp. WMMC2535 TaxID=2712867 RepID=UPI0015576DF6|nr:DUF934 domain-containing protein [Pseudenhygromyxa sp. WMMC2535]NVB43271.1 DUF934 domain-containing protein [Pseudenhygromyxa sp. WMMC2535]
MAESSNDKRLRLCGAGASAEGGASILAIVDGAPAIVCDAWKQLTQDEAQPAAGKLPATRKLPAARKLIVTPARFAELAAQREAAGAALELGVRVPGETEPEALLEALGLEQLGEGSGAPTLIAIEVPKFTDGRHFSLARLLRERHGYRGELRVVGDVTPDQLFYMRRCGYDSFVLREGESLATGLRTLAAFSVAYQGAADDARPLYRRRA